ncbi:MAG TPA: hypothetical protein VGI06_15345 [Acidimicrobiales bacterium]|jgi:hypothetical protein
MDGVEILQGLRVLSCAADGPDLLVSLYGGQTCACGSVRWEGGMARSRLRQLRRWRDEGTLVTYVRRGTTVTLVDEFALLRGALPDWASNPPDAITN